MRWQRESGDLSAGQGAGADELFAIQDQLEKETECCFRYGFRTVHEILAGWDEFYRMEDCIEESKLIICEYSQVLLELSSFSIPQRQMREISRQPQLPENGASVARWVTACNSTT